MFKEMAKSHGNVLGFEASGTITKDDYSTIDPIVKKAIEDHGTINVLMDLSTFDSEQIRAWGKDFQFGHEFHKQIAKMAIVGDSGLDTWLAKVAGPLYAHEVKVFRTTAEAWDWVDAAS